METSGDRMDEYEQIDQQQPKKKAKTVRSTRRNKSNATQKRRKNTQKSKRTKDNNKKKGKKPAEREEKPKKSIMRRIRGEAIDDFVERTVTERCATLRAKHQHLNQAAPSTQNFIACGELNRADNVLLYDRNRVKPMPDPKLLNDELYIPYIHASWVNKNQYILTQAPMQNTVLDFWRMIWHEKVTLIVCLCRLIPGNSNCSLYLNPEIGKSLNVDGQFKIKNTTSKKRENEGHTTVTDLEVQKGNGLLNRKKRKILHMSCTEWTDDNATPPLGLLKFAECVWEHRNSMEAMKDRISASKPIVIHCINGAKRSGTLAALIACLVEHHKTEQVDVASIVREIRRDRHGTFDDFSHYAFLYQCLVEYCIEKSEISINEAQNLREELRRTIVFPDYQAAK